MIYMVDSQAYPLGDVQTWDERLGDQVRPDLTASLTSLLPPGEASVHVFGTQPRIRDKWSGMSYLPTEPLKVDLSSMDRHEREIINAATARFHLGMAAGRPVPKFDPRDVIAGVPSLLSMPVVDFEASSKAECEAHLQLIKEALGPAKRLKRLWLRGQAEDHAPKIPQPAQVREWLYFGRAGASFPSLVPTLGRFALGKPGKIDSAHAARGPSHAWEKPFFMWVVRQNPQWLEGCPEFRDRLEASLRSEEELLFDELLREMKYDPRVATEVDDLRQWFFAHYKYSAWVWVLQQYGCRASMLDVTWDLDSALFFTQGMMVDGRFALPPPQEGRVIYVFAEWRDSTVFWDVQRVDWGDADWAKHRPPRVQNQRAGCILGCTWFRQNFHGHMVIARIWIKGDQCVTTRTIKEVFPPPEKDLLQQTLMEVRPLPEGLYF